MLEIFDELLKDVKPAQPEEVKPEPAPVVEEQEEEVEEKQPEPVLPPPPAPVAAKANAKDLLAAKWEVSREDYDAAFEDGKIDPKIEELIQKLIDEKHEAEKKAAELGRYEDIPAVKESKYAEQLASTWNDNYEVWSEELLDVIPEEAKLLKGLGKRKLNELGKFIEEQSGVLLLERLKAGKKPLNPLLAKSSAIAEKVRELSTPEVPKQEAPKPEAPQFVQPEQPQPQPKPVQKKIASISGGATTTAVEINVPPVLKRMREDWKFMGL